MIRTSFPTTTPVSPTKPRTRDISEGPSCLVLSAYKVVTVAGGVFILFASLALCHVDLIHPLAMQGALFFGASSEAFAALILTTGFLGTTVGVVGWKFGGFKKAPPQPIRQPKTILPLSPTKQLRAADAPPETLEGLFATIKNLSASHSSLREQNLHLQRERDEARRALDEVRRVAGGQTAIDPIAIPAAHAQTLGASAPPPVYAASSFLEPLAETAQHHPVQAHPLQPPVSAATFLTHAALAPEPSAPPTLAAPDSSSYEPLQASTVAPTVHPQPLNPPGDEWVPKGLVFSDTPPAPAAPPPPNPPVLVLSQPPKAPIAPPYEPSSASQKSALQAPKAPPLANALEPIASASLALPQGNVLEPPAAPTAPPPPAAPPPTPVVALSLPPKTPKAPAPPAAPVAPPYVPPSVAQESDSQAPKALPQANVLEPPVAPAAPPPPAAPLPVISDGAPAGSDSRNDLLAAIRKGSKLKPSKNSDAAKPKGANSNPGGMLGAFVGHASVIRSQVESDSDDDQPKTTWDT